MAFDLNLHDRPSWSVLLERVDGRLTPPELGGARMPHFGMSEKQDTEKREGKVIGSMP